ncbi:GNAT family N-acetyltransferase [Knoellia sp. LjRoot47]|uniref:GNAT family N-acetyltransferase n=1 Tax=Knoellia sp. LjRoot47 TaxID=3342330 RepID=UPI003ECC5C4D
MTHVRELSAADDIRAVHEQLLTPAFPPEELETVEWMLERAAAGQLTIRVLDRDGPAAVSVTETLGPTGSVLLDYFATRSDLRGTGLGSALLGDMLAVVRERNHPRLILAEVERPDRHPSSPGHGDPAARLRFYRRHGARALDLPYFQPALGSGPPVHGMLLLVLWASPDVVVRVGGHDNEQDRRGVPGGVVLPVLRAIFGEALEDSHPETVALRAAATSEVVALRDPVDYPEIASSR